MALTDAQKAKVRRYLGFPDVNRLSFHTIEGAMTSLSTEGETEVVDCLTKLATVEGNLASAWDRQKVIKAEEVTLAADGEIRAHRAEGRRLVCTLAAILDVQPRWDVFGSPGGGAGIAGRG